MLTEGKEKTNLLCIYGASIPNSGLGDAVATCSWSGGISHVPGDCRGAAPKCTAGENQASFWAQQRCEEVTRLRRVLCVVSRQGKALGWALAGKSGYLLTNGADVLSHAGGSDPMQNRVMDFLCCWTYGQSGI